MVQINAVNTSLSGQSGTGQFLGNNGGTLISPALGTPSSGNLVNCNGLIPSTGLSASGSPSTTTYIRGDNSWSTIPGNLLGIRGFGSGSGTYTPTSGMKFIVVEMCGGGGGSGGCSASSNSIALSGPGGPGAYLKFYMTAAQVGASISYSVGGGGAAGTGTTTPGNGGTGGATQLGSWSAGGGVGSLAVTNATQNRNSNGGAGGIALLGTGTLILSNTANSGSSYAFAAGGLYVINLNTGGTNFLSVNSGNFLTTVTNGSGSGTVPLPYAFMSGFGGGARSICAYSGLLGPVSSTPGSSGFDGAIFIYEFI